MAAQDTSLEVYRPQTAVEIRAQVNLIQEVMRSVMKENTHFGIIPGCQKPSLWKPGAEVLFSTFRISVDPLVEDFSTEDEARFRVTARATSNHGTPLGSAVGEASSSEEKYNWREVVCREEWEATAEDHRRTKWKRGKSGAYSVQQVLTNIPDVRNTILKMASKRASVALALQVTAASDIFTQDIEDVPEESREAVINGDAVKADLPTDIKKKEPQSSGTASPSTAPATPQNVAPKPSPQPPPAPAAEHPKPRPQVQSPQSPQVRVISEAQARRFYAIRKGTGWSDEETSRHLKSLGINSDREIPATMYDELCAWAEGKGL